MSDSTRWEALAREWAERPMSMVPFRVYSSHNVLLDSFRGFLAEFAAAVEAQARAEDDSRVREFVGWLSADIPELHGVEVPLLAESLERFLQAKEAR